MKKLIATMLIVLLALGAVFANGSEETAATSTAAAKKTYKIGFARILEGETWEQQRVYMDEEVAPALNCSFIYSEKIQDGNSLRDFMEQCYAAGCDGIVNCYTENSAAAMAARLCEDWGIYYITNNSNIAKDVATLPHNIGHIGASPDGMNKAYKEAFEYILSDGKDHSVYMFAGASVGGAIGQGAASHYYSTYGMLQAMQEHYGLKYDKSIDEIINTKAPGEVNTGNPNVKIYIYSGFTDIPGAIKSAQTQLQSGPYDIFVSVTMFSTFSNVIDAVEKSTGKDIKTITTAAIEAQTATGFATKDSTGDSVINVACVNATTTSCGWLAACITSSIEAGSADAYKDASGSVQFFGKDPWVIKSAAEYEDVAKLDLGHDSYVVSGEELKKIHDTKTLQASIDYSEDLQKVIADKVRK